MRSSIWRERSRLPNLAMRYCGAVDALARHVGIELEGMPGDGEAQVLLLQEVERALELALADVAPRADHIGDDVDTADRLRPGPWRIPSRLRNSLYPRRIAGNEETLMEKPKYRSALIVGTGPGLSASLARPVGQERARRRARRPPDRQARRPRQGDRRGGSCLQRRRSRRTLPALFDALDAAKRTPDVAGSARALWRGVSHIGRRSGDRHLAPALVSRWIGAQLSGG